MSGKNRKSRSNSREAEGPGRRARMAAARQQAERDQARRALMRRTGIAVGALVLVGGVVGGAIALSDAGGNGQGSGAGRIPAHPIIRVSGAAADPPWAAPADPSARVAAARLPMLGSEGEVLHIHSHLDVIVDGRAVTVPSGVGVDDGKHVVSPLHTHDTTGVIHIESPRKADFTLAQFMTEWNVALTADNIGGLKTGDSEELHVYVNGKEHSGNPGAIRLGSHQEIAIVYGRAGETVTVPDGYSFPPGE